MPDIENFAAALKVNIVHCENCPTFSDDIVLPKLFGSFSCKRCVPAFKSTIDSASTQGIPTNTQSASAYAAECCEDSPIVVVKPGCVDEPRLLILRPLMVRVIEKGKPSADADPAGKPEDLEKVLPIDAVLDRTTLGKSLQFLVEAVGAAENGERYQPQQQQGYQGRDDMSIASEKKVPAWRSLPRTQVYYDGMLSLLLEGFSATAQLRFRMAEHIEAIDTKKYGEVLGVIVQVSGANGTPG